MQLNDILGAKVFGYDTYGEIDDLYFVDMELQLKSSDKKKVISLYDILEDEYTPFKFEIKSEIGFTSLTDHWSKIAYNPGNHWTTSIRFNKPLNLEGIEKKRDVYIITINSK